jgi:hypothetical protein
LFYILDELGNVVPEPDTNKFLKWRRDNGDRCSLAFDSFGPVDVSTRFLCTEVGKSKNGKPLLWETMVFGGELEPIILHATYDNEEDAYKGHQVALTKYGLHIRN